MFYVVSRTTVVKYMGRSHNLVCKQNDNSFDTRHHEPVWRKFGGWSDAVLIQKTEYCSWRTFNWCAYLTPFKS